MPSPVVCPCCRASNETGPTCRRCKADLGLMFELESRREFLLARARQHVEARQFSDALPLAEEAHSLRASADSQKLRVSLLLLGGKFAEAWQTYREPAK